MPLAEIGSKTQSSGLIFAFGLAPSHLRMLTNLQVPEMKYLWVVFSDLSSSQLIVVLIDLVQVQNQTGNCSVVLLPVADSPLAS
jgi:hypothetical protein